MVAANDPQGIRSLLRTSRSVMSEAYSEILSRQRHEFEPAKTGYKYLDDALLGGLFPQKVVTIGARPSTGKSFVTQKICETLMDVSVNPQAGEYLLVNFEFEMVAVDLLSRKIMRELKKPVSSFMTSRQTGEEDRRIREIAESGMARNVLYVMKPVTVRELEAIIGYVAERNEDKKLVMFKIDHIALVSREGGDAKKVMDSALSVINNAKLRYKNVSFIIVSQFNREIEGRRNPKEHEPRMSDFYQSDELSQLSTVMVGLNNPRRMGYDKYMLFPASWYPSLDRFKTQNKTSFQTEGLIFHHLLKVRDTRMEELKDVIYPEIMPGNGWRYGEGGVRVVNTERDPDAKKPFQAEGGKEYDAEELFGE